MRTKMRTKIINLGETLEHELKTQSYNDGSQIEPDKNEDEDDEEEYEDY